jgi:hypothetical protein
MGGHRVGSGGTRPTEDRQEPELPAPRAPFAARAAIASAGESLEKSGDAHPGLNG